MKVIQAFKTNEFNIGKNQEERVKWPMKPLKGMCVKSAGQLIWSPRAAKGNSSAAASPW
jgi:hypothetical protein